MGKTSTPRGHMGAGRGNEKAKDFKKSIKYLLSYIKSYRIWIIVALVFAAMSTIIGITAPKILGKIATQIQLDLQNGRNINLTKIGKIGVELIVIYLTSAILLYAQNFIMAGVSNKVAKSFRNDISKKINKLPLKYFDSRNYGDVLSVVTNDIDTISQTLNQSLSSMITSISTLIGIIVMMLSISWQLSIVAFVAVPVSMTLMLLIIKKSQKYFTIQQKSLGEINGHIEEIYSSHNVIKAFNGEEESIQTFETINEQLYSSAWKSQFLSGMMQPIMSFVGNLSYVAVCVVGGSLALKGTLLIGDITSMVTYVRRFNNPLNQIAQIANTLQSTAAAAERVFEFLNEEEMSSEEDKITFDKEVKGLVEFKNVCFGYEKDKPIIKNFSMIAKPGQKVAIVGPTGAGKTTMVNLLMKFYEIDSGDILIDGISIKDLKRSECHKMFSMVLQDTWLFEGTIKENLSYGKDDVSLEQIKEAAKMAYIHHYIKTLPNGYDHYIDENSSLSMGQKQLFTIARAMVENAPMLILDEATSSVDTRTEKLIQQAMDNLSKGRTSFVIAHRLSTIKNADNIIVMKEGQIVEVGNHEQLMEQNGFYSTLYNSQFEEDAEY